jgi:hypothetical protein
MWAVIYKSDSSRVFFSPRSQTPDDVRACFGAFGTLTDSVIIGDGTIRRGFGFVTFGTYSVPRCTMRTPREVLRLKSIKLCENIGNLFAAHVIA